MLSPHETRVMVLGLLTLLALLGAVASVFLSSDPMVGEQRAGRWSVAAIVLSVIAIAVGIFH